MVERQRFGFVALASDWQQQFNADQLLADIEHEILLFDHRAPYEKLCGGGLSPLVGRQFPDAMTLPFPRHRPPRVVLRASDGSQVEQELNTSNWAIVSRAVFGRAFGIGRLRHVRQRVKDVERTGEGWLLRCAGGETFSAEYLVSSDGVRSPVRRKVVGAIPREHLGSAVGYWLHGEPDAIVFQTYSDLEGYLWSFPRLNHAAVGIAWDRSSTTTAAREP